MNHKVKIRTFVTSDPNGVIFTNNAELGEEEKVGFFARRRTPEARHKNWGKNMLSAKLEGACANVEYVGASQLLAMLVC